MEVIDAIRRRASIRAFKPDPIPKETIERILQVALRAPSWTNVQPWEFAIVTGEPLARLKRALAARGANQDSPAKPDIAWPTFSDPYERRRKQLGLSIYGIKKIGEKIRERSLNGISRASGSLTPPSP